MKKSVSLKQWLALIWWLRKREARDTFASWFAWAERLPPGVKLSFTGRKIVTTKSSETQVAAESHLGAA